MAIDAWRRIQTCGLLLLLVAALGTAQNNSGTTCFPGYECPI